ncbi:MAG TPA: efflux RND transporter periplasmic adaptor subunit [Gammaproteobacteria bacterium]|jgi:RND family efflux transporter MFP subunit
MRLKVSSILVPIVIVALAITGYFYLGNNGQKAKGKKKEQAVPVEVAPVQQRPIALRRNFTGTMEANAEFTVSAKIDGRIDELKVDLGDMVSRGQLVAVLDSAEYQQAVAQAEADKAVAAANLAEARSQLVIAERELQRLDSLTKKGISSASQRDTAKAEQLARGAHVQVSQAQLARAEAQLETARIRLAYTRVRASWQGEHESRVVAQRFLDEGEIVAANQPLLHIVDLDPIIAVFYVTERDYAQLALQQEVELLTDVYPGVVFEGRISRIAPVFDEDTRQARVEATVINDDGRLKPGMYVRAQVVLKMVEQTTVVPEQALTTRERQKGIFIIKEGSEQVVWRPVQVGIREANMIQVTGSDLKGRVVTLGQQLLDDGTRVLIQSRRKLE